MISHLDWYGAILENILRHGRRVGPRSLMTWEVLNAAVELDLRQNIVVDPTRAPNYRFMVAEWLWMASGRGDLAPLAAFNPRMAAFSDDGLSLAGAYGPYIRSQLPRVLACLRNDPDTRQAFVKIGEHGQLPSKDVPCTLTFQFLLRAGALHMTANMRSSDAWLGIPYDVFSFSQIGNSVAGELGAEPGRLHLNLASSHLYAEHLDAATLLVSRGETGYVRSPALPGLPPGALERAWLVDVGAALDRPWDRYNRALRAKNSLEALACLSS